MLGLGHQRKAQQKVAAPILNPDLANLVFEQLLGYIFAWKGQNVYSSEFCRVAEPASQVLPCCLLSEVLTPGCGLEPRAEVGVGMIQLWLKKNPHILSPPCKCSSVSTGGHLPNGSHAVFSPLFWMCLDVASRWDHSCVGHCCRAPSKGQVPSRVLHTHHLV